MARIQILELPEGAADQRPPFVLVIDQYEPIRYVLGMGQDDQPQPVSPFEGVADQIGARAVLVFEDTTDIPANDVPASFNSQTVDEQPVLQQRAERAEKRCEELRAETLRRGKEKLEYAERNRQLETALDEARTWARHGYEIGQRHCGWTDHGIAPAWLTEGWPPHMDSCEHLKRAAEYDEALARVRGLAERLDGPDWPRPENFLNGYAAGIRAAKRAIPEPSHTENDDG